MHLNSLSFQSLGEHGLPNQFLQISARVELGWTTDMPN